MDRKRDRLGKPDAGQDKQNIIENETGFIFSDGRAKEDIYFCLFVLPSEK